MVLGAVASFLAISPAAMPSGPALTSRRKTASRPSWARAEREWAAAVISIFHVSLKYRSESNKAFGKRELQLHRGAQRAIFGQGTDFDLQALRPDDRAHAFARKTEANRQLLHGCPIRESLENSQVAVTTS